MTRETTDFESPARPATSMIVGTRAGAGGRFRVGALDIIRSRSILAGKFPWGHFPENKARGGGGRGTLGWWGLEEKSRRQPPAGNAARRRRGRTSSHLA